MLTLLRAIFVILNLSNFLEIIFTATSDSDNVKSPLILTPFLQSAKIDEARRLSKVPPLLPKIYSNAGFFTVNDTHNCNLFFWFFRKTSSDWKKSPLLLWLHGGPGASFMPAVFLETGPFYIFKNETKRRKYSWINNYNVLYIDQPVGTGFSFSNDDLGLLETINESALQVYNALLQFYTLYSELKTNKLYITCESYGCKFGVALLQEIRKRKTTSGSFINLIGIYMESGFVDPTYYIEYSDNLHIRGLIDYRTKIKFQHLEEKMKVHILAGQRTEAFEMWQNYYKMFKASTYGVNYNNIIYENYGQDSSYIEYVKSDNMRKALHVGDLVFNASSPIVFNLLKNDHFRSEIPQIEKLLDSYKFLIASGQLDIHILPSCKKNSLRHLRWVNAENYNLAKRQKLYIDDNLVGYYTKAGNLISVLVRNAGHMLSLSYPYYTLELLNKFVNDEL